MSRVGTNLSHATTALWHDLECGAYRADLELWRALAAEHGDPVLDVGAGTGRVSLELARAGHRVTALDRDPLLLAELERRVPGLPVTTVPADARRFALNERFPLIIVPMQTIQLLEGAQGRQQFLRCAARHLKPEGRLAIAITEVFDQYSAQDDLPLPLPDIRELDGVVYSSQPMAAREEAGVFTLERLRETVTTTGERSTERDVVRLDCLTAGELRREAADEGLRPAGTRTIAPTSEHVGSLVVIFRG